jgi:CDGSH-type Zn-finger protein
MAAESPKPQVVPLPDGPYYLLTDFTPRPVEGLRDAAGGPIANVHGTALCRCGQSENKPFCDGSHGPAGFSGAKGTLAARDRRRDYPGTAITVHDNRALCSHSKECFRTLPEVFDPDARPWIVPDGAAAERVIEAVRRCPSGALSYSVGGVEHRDREREPMVTVSRDGPYHLTGGVEVPGEARNQGASLEHCALCRCGESANKPFCDGAHLDAGFQDG